MEFVWNLSFVIWDLMNFILVKGKTVKSIEISQENIEKNNELNHIDSLDFFLNDDEINKKN